MFSQSKIYAFIGKQISVERVPSRNSFYLKYKNVYKVEKSFDEEISSDTISFDSYTHMNQIQYSFYDLVIIYLVKDETGKLVHKRTYYTPIILNENGTWYGFNLSDNDFENYKSFPSKKLKIRKNLKIVKQKYSEIKKRKYLIQVSFPEKFFTPLNRNTVKVKMLKNADSLYHENKKAIFELKN